jgi:hypothetical protein
MEEGFINRRYITIGATQVETQIKLGKRKKLMKHKKRVRRNQKQRTVF